MFKSARRSNKFLSRIWEEKEREIHQKKLKRAKSRIDQSCPMSFGNLKRKPKREQLLEERSLEIERENKILLDKMTSIMKNQQFMHKPPKKPSLNQALRQKHQEEISSQNFLYKKRLQEKQPHYSASAWEEDRKKHEKRLRYLCEYPYQLTNAKRTSKSSAVIHNRKLSPLKEELIVTTKHMNATDYKISVYKSLNKFIVQASDGSHTYRYECPSSTEDLPDLVASLRWEDFSLI